MQKSTERATKITISKKSLIELLKGQNPTDLDIQAIPTDGTNVALYASYGSNGRTLADTISLTITKNTDVLRTQAPTTTPSPPQSAA